MRRAKWNGRFVRAFGRSALAAAIGALVLGVAVPAYASGASASLVVTYIANDGFLLQFPSGTILVDGLFSGASGGLVNPSAAVVADLTSGTGRFGRVDVVLCTHAHGDHFSPTLVARAMAGNPDCVAVGPTSVVERVAPFVGGADRLRALDPAVGERVTTLVRGIEITALRLEHADMPGVTVVGYLIKADGLCVLHLGDGAVLGAGDVAAYGLSGDQVDLAFCNYWGFWEYGWDGSFLRQAIAPRAVVVMHLEADRVDDIAQQAAAADAGFPFYVFRRPLDRATFVKTGTDFRCVSLPGAASG